MRLLRPATRRTGWGRRAGSAAAINPLDQGVGWLVAEAGHPRRIKVAYLDDTAIIRLAAYARDIRRPSRSVADTNTPAGQPDTPDLGQAA